MTKKQDILFGIHAVEALLTNHPERVLRLAAQQDRADKKIQMLIQLAKEVGISVESCNRQTLDRFTQNQSHQGIVAFCRKAESMTEATLQHLLDTLTAPPFLLILDGIQDPHNLGACMRTADAAGVQAVIAPKDKSVGMTSAVSKVASGAAETLPFVQVTNLARTLSELKARGIWIYGAAEDGAQSVYQADLRGPVAIVLGSEGTGIRRLTREHCDHIISIPMCGSVSSLNVSVATGVLLFEALRQRQG